MIELVAAINDRLSRGEALAAVTIVTNEGSTPRTAGSKMLVFADGSIAGTVGGGPRSGSGRFSNQVGRGSGSA